MLPIALQLYSVREELEQDFEGTLAKVHEMGYEGVEFAGLYGKSVQEIQSLLEKYALTAVSAHVPFQDMLENPEQLFTTYAALGCSYIAVPYLTEEYRMNGPQAEEAYEGIRKLAITAKEHGLTMLYHNHDFEFVRMTDGEFGLDKLYRLIPADLLQTEIDTCWVHVAGVDPVEYLRKYTGRAPLVHLKDFVMEGSAEGAYELIGLEQEATAAKDTFEFRTLGTGKQDIPAIIKASEEAGAKWLIVEQDRPSQGFTPMECAAKSIEYLKTLEA